MYSGLNICRPVASFDSEGVLRWTKLKPQTTLCNKFRKSKKNCKFLTTLEKMVFCCCAAVENYVFFAKFSAPSTKIWRFFYASAGDASENFGIFCWEQYFCASGRKGSSNFWPFCSAGGPGAPSAPPGYLPDIGSPHKDWLQKRVYVLIWLSQSHPLAK